MKIKSNDITVSKKQGIANIGYYELIELRLRINEMREILPYVSKEKHWIIELKINACNDMIKNMQNVIHTLSNKAPMRHQL